MFETGASSESAFSISQAIDGIYDWSTAEFGQPIALNLFDHRLSEAIDFNWFADSVAKCGVTEQELQELLSKCLKRISYTQR